MPTSRSAPAISYCYASQAADGPTIANTTSATEMINPEARLPLPAGSLNTPGQKLKVRGTGKFSSNGGAQTITIDLRTAAGATVVWTSGTINLTTTAHALGSPILFDFEINLTLRVAGSSATLEGQGKIISLGVAAFSGQADPSTNGHNVVLIGPQPPAQGNSWDSSPRTSNDLTCFLTWSAASANNSWTLTEYEAELRN